MLSAAGRYRRCARRRASVSRWPSRGRWPWRTPCRLLLARCSVTPPLGCWLSVLLPLMLPSPVTARARRQDGLVSAPVESSSLFSLSSRLSSTCRASCKYTSSRWRLVKQDVIGQWLAVSTVSPIGQFIIWTRHRAVLPGIFFGRRVLWKKDFLQLDLVIDRGQT